MTKPRVDDIDFGERDPLPDFDPDLARLAAVPEGTPQRLADQLDLLLTVDRPDPVMATNVLAAVGTDPTWLPLPDHVKAGISASLRRRGVDQDVLTMNLGRVNLRTGLWENPPGSGSTNTPIQPAEPLEAADIDWSVDPPPRRWLVDGLIPAGRVSALYGAGEVGKSRMLLQLSIAVIHEEDGAMLPADRLATGEASRDVPEVLEHGAVIMLTWEDEVVELQRRVQLLRNAGAIPAGVTTKALGDRLRVVDMRAVGGPLWAPRADGSRHVASEGEWTTAGRRLLALMERERPALVTIDPLAAAYACSEIDRALVRRFVSSLDAAAEAFSVTVLLCGHPPKSAADYSGSTDWRNAVRGMLTLGQTDTAYREPQVAGGKQGSRVAAPCLRREKSSYGPHREAIWLRSQWSADPRPELAWFATDERAAARAVCPDASLTGEAATDAKSNGGGAVVPMRVAP